MLSFNDFVNSYDVFNTELLYNKEGIIRCYEYAKVDSSMYFESLCLKDYSYTNTKLFRCERFDNFNINKLILTQNYVYTYNVQKIIKEMKKGYFKKEPLIVLYHNNNYYLQDGHHRYFSLKFLHINNYPIILYKKVKNENQ